ncbi:MAG: hypothetical protein O3B28_09670, partial [Proteobacteria bacterium]|nr:hypothetical protein [Pseudomonadota bacterium]
LKDSSKKEILGFSSPYCRLNHSFFVRSVTSHMSATFPMTASQTRLFTPISRDYDKDLPVVQVIPLT